MNTQRRVARKGYEGGRADIDVTTHTGVLAPAEKQLSVAGGTVGTSWTFHTESVTEP